MLAQFDTIIGFVVVMSVVSLLIMVFTQIVSSFLGLRGKNLADALESMFHRVAPGLHVAGCTDLIHLALTDPAISDSTLSMRRKEGVFLRNIGLLRDLRDRWKKASAIRPGELYDYLTEKAQGPVSKMTESLADVPPSFERACAAIVAHVQAAPYTADLRAAVTNLRRAGHSCEALQQSLALGHPPLHLTNSFEGAFAAAESALGKVEQVNGARLPASVAFALNNARVGLHRMCVLKADYERNRGLFPDPRKWPSSVEAALTAKKLLDTLKAKLAKGVTGAGGTSGNAATVNLEELARAEFEKGFDSVQGRAQQWFTLHARMLTVVGAVGAAFFLPLDGIDLIGTLSANPEIRAKLVAAADAVNRQADGVVRQLVDPQTHRAVLTQLRASYPQTTFPPALDTVPAQKTLAEVEQWLQGALGNTDKATVEMIVVKYNLLYLQTSAETYKKILGEMGQANSNTGLRLVPEPYPLEYDPAWLTDHPYFPFKAKGDYWARPWRRLAGILFSAALLSLGGPFWFNLLKQLSDLRPALADAVDADAGKKKPPPAKAPTTG